MKKTVIAFGELLWDLLPDETILGGAPFNFTYRIHDLGDTGVMVSRIGNDDLGRQAFARVEDLGLDTSCIQWDNHKPTGTVKVSFDEDYNPDYVIIPDVAYDRVELTDKLLDVAENSDCFCYGTLAQRSPKSRDTLAALLEAATDTLKFLDINLRKECYTRETVTFSMEKADILKTNDEEAVKLCEMFDLPLNTLPKFCQTCIDTWSLEYCLVTFGANGAFVYAAAGEYLYEPGYDVALADSLGAGDAFSAGFIHKFLRGSTLREACEFGNRLGALVATKNGATAPVSGRELQRFAARDRPRNVQSDLEKYIQK